MCHLCLGLCVQLFLMFQFSGLIALIMTAPSVLFGAIARATRWEETGYGHTPSEDGKDGFDDRKLVLPLCLQYLTPRKSGLFNVPAG